MTEKHEDDTPQTGATGGDETPKAANDTDAQAGAGGERVQSFADKAREGGRVSELEAEVAQLKDQLLRAMAETENVRKRGERQSEDARRYAATGFARDMLSVADNLERALDAVPAERRDESDLMQTLLGGLESVRGELLRTLQQHNIERIEPLGEPFDPNLHEAMFEVPGSEYPNGTVAQVVQPGYRLHDRLLRPARVGVSKSAGDGQPKVDTTA